MKKYKLILGLTALATTLTPAIALASCGNQATTYKAIPESMLNFEGNVLLGLKEGASIDAYDTLVVPQDTVYIADEAFKDAFVEGASTIKTIIFNKNLKSIGSSAFENCTSLTCLDLTAMKDINVMSLRLGDSTTFASCSNKSGRVKLPEGITDMQLEWIKTQFENAGLPGSWFGDVEAPDQEIVDAINAILEQQTTACSTMSDLIDYVYAQSGYDLEALVPTNANEQYVWDAKKNKVIEIDQSGNLTCGPKDYKLEAKPINIWKMVKPVGTSKALKASSSNDAIYADEFSETTTYSQYLRTEYKQTWEATKSFSFQSGFDTGNVEKLELTYKEPEVEAGDAPVINTMKSSLTIEGSLDSIDHYGNLTELTVESLGTAETYSEYGSVDAAIIVKSGSISLESTAEVNEVIVAATTASDVSIDITTGAEIGTIGATTKEVAEQLTSESNPIVTGDTQTTVGNIEDEDPTPTPDPSPTAQFYSGDGTEDAPYTIKTLAHLQNFATLVNGQETGGKDLYFNLIADIDLNGAEWTPVGTQSVPFKGIFNGCGFKISNFKISSSSQSKGVGFFGWTSGTENSNYSNVGDIWDYQDDKLITENSKIDETYYETRIKNLTLDKVNINLTGEIKAVGGLVGSACNTFLYNNHIVSGTIKANKHVGGLNGTAYGSIFEECSVGSDDFDNPLSVTTDTYSAGGISGSFDYLSGYTCGAYILCKTYPNVTVKANNLTAASVAGIMGYNCGCKGLVIDACTNYATIEATNTTEASGDNPEWQQGVAGITGFGQSVGVIANCANHGDLKTATGSFVNNVAGITNNPSCNLIYNCLNDHDITVTAKLSLAGIAGNAVNDSSSSGLEIKNCANEGTLTNQYATPKYKTADIASGICVLVFKNQTFTNVDAVSKAIEAAAGTSVRIIFKDCTVEDTNGTLVLPTNVASITSNNPICSNINVSQSMTSLTFDVPNLTVSVSLETNCDITCKGENSTIEITSTGQVKNAIATGNGSQVVNNGTVLRTIGIDGGATKGTNNGTCANITFGKTEVSVCDKTFVNNGEITGLADSSQSNNAVIYTKGDATNESPTNHTVTIENNGIIQYQNNGLSTPAPFFQMDALCMHIVLKCYSGSSIINDQSINWYSIFNGSDSILFKVKPSGVTLKEAGLDITFDQLVAKSNYASWEEF